MGSVARDHRSTPLLWVVLVDCIEGARGRKVPRSAERAPQDDNDGERGKRSPDHATALGGLVDCIGAHAVVGSLGAPERAPQDDNDGERGKRSPDHAAALGGPRSAASRGHAVVGSLGALSRAPQDD
jgi:hypothetical protein